MSDKTFGRLVLTVVTVLWMLGVYSTVDALFLLLVGLLFLKLPK